MLIESEKLLKDLNKVLEENTPTGWETPLQYNVMNLVKDAVEECIKVVKSQKPASEVEDDE